ncbi:hypothetical protein CUU62_25810 [Pseudomonas sp. WP001]|nr:hypothetical protein CUU62_25810 [Pseudomonas sp. WP001]
MQQRLYNRSSTAWWHEHQLGGKHAGQQQIQDGARNGDVQTYRVTREQMNRRRIDKGRRQQETSEHQPGARHGATMHAASHGMRQFMQDQPRQHSHAKGCPMDGR